MPERRFVRFLLEQRFVYRTASGNVLPYAKPSNDGLFCVKDYCNHGHMPYILMGLFATNFGEGWRMAVGADASAKMLSFFTTLPKALASWWPSLHPLDLIVGLCCGAGLRLAVYLKSKNAKKYRHGMEYGSARWSA